MEEARSFRVKECHCDKWKRNIYKLIFPFLLPLTAVGIYSGEQITHCPWCGEELQNYSQEN